MDITLSQVQALINAQFPHWSHLAIRPVAVSGWDNRTFHLGEEMVVRMPSAACYAYQVAKEQTWLPYLATHLPLAIATPLAMGAPGAGYPWRWSIYRWLTGETVAASKAVDTLQLARDLAHFIFALQQIDTHGGPIAGEHNFYRGGDLSIYASQAKEAIEAQQAHRSLLNEIWQVGNQSVWEQAGVWVHGDVSVGNLLLNDGKLCAVIDFGQLGVGDPACDYVMAWTFFDKPSRALFREHLQIDTPTWARARAWALWKAVIVLADPTSCHHVEAARTLREIINEYQGGGERDPALCLARK